MPSDVDSVQAAYPVSTFWIENLQCVCSHALYCTMHTWELSDLMFTGFDGFNDHVPVHEIVIRFLAY